MTFALFVGIVLTALAGIFCAASALFAWRSWQAASKAPSMTSIHAELIEIRDYMGKVDQWAKRINGREAVRESREKNSAGRLMPSSPNVSSISDKDELRRMVGLVAGKVAPHKE